MYKIKDIKIEGLWGIKDINLSLNLDINFLIGRNGSGKTTILNILTSTLNLDLSGIDSLDFKKIEIKLVDDKKRKKIILEKNLEREIIYEISKKKYVFSDRIIRNFSKRNEILHISRFNRIGEVSELKNELKNIIDIKLLDTNRLTRNKEDYEREVYEEYNRYIHRGNIINPVDVKLDFLIKELKTYKLTLKARLESLTADFQKEVLELLIYDKDSDNNSSKKMTPDTINQIENDLREFYKEFNYRKEDVNKKISGHTSRLKEELGKELADEDYKTNLVLLTRTQKVLEIVKELKKEKEKILLPINLYLENLNAFMDDKEYSISDEGELNILLKNRKKSIKSEELSSGEKQIVILMTEILLQKNKTNVFIADEPELSLHIGWQRELVNAILRLNSEAQIIFATHSPDIVNGKEKYIVKI